MTSPLPAGVVSSVENLLEQVHGSPVRITSARPVGGGCVNRCARIETDRGTTLFLKWNERSLAEMFLAEADGLRALRGVAAPHELRIPEVIGVGCSDERGSSQSSWLLIEYIESGAGGRRYGATLGAALAGLHGAPIVDGGGAGARASGSRSSESSTSESSTSGSRASESNTSRSGTSESSTREASPLDSGTSSTSDSRTPEWSSSESSTPEASTSELVSSPMVADSALYGWHRDNFIGPLPQANPRSEDWANFWRDARLAPQVSLARERGFLARDDQRQLDRLLERTADALAGAEADGPSLLHGDLWSGNVFPDANGQPVLVDPAVYVGHREVDIAMSELFGGFPAGFMEAYHEARPLDEAYRRIRRPLYQLYYLLVHVNLFGESYLSGTRGAARAVLQAL